ncbi:MAG: hypothetical protein ACE5GS_00790 [Kiloniellaceae bacterium]
MRGKMIRNVTYVLVFALLPFAVQWGVLPPVVSTAQAQSDDAAKSLMDAINRALDCGVIGNVGVNRCKEEPDSGVGPDTRGDSRDRADACEECNFRANELREKWRDLRKRWNDRKAELEAQGIHEGTREYREDQTLRELWKERDRLRRKWEDLSDGCFESECKIGKITDKKTSAPRTKPSSAPTSAPSSKPSATPAPSGKPPRDKYESCGQINDPKYRDDDEYISWYNEYCT